MSTGKAAVFLGPGKPFARWPFDRLISHTYPLGQINQAFAESEWQAKDPTRITRAALAP